MTPEQKLQLSKIRRAETLRRRKNMTQAEKAEDRRKMKNGWRPEAVPEAVPEAKPKAQPKTLSKKQKETLEKRRATILRRKNMSKAEIEADKKAVSAATRNSRRPAIPTDLARVLKARSKQQRRTTLDIRKNMTKSQREMDKIRMKNQKYISPSLKQIRTPILKSSDRNVPIPRDIIKFNIWFHQEGEPTHWVTYGDHEKRLQTFTKPRWMSYNTPEFDRYVIDYLNNLTKILGETTDGYGVDYSKFDNIPLYELSDIEPNDDSYFGNVNLRDIKAFRASSTIQYKFVRESECVLHSLVEYSKNTPNCPRFTYYQLEKDLDFTWKGVKVQNLVDWLKTNDIDFKMIKPDGSMYSSHVSTRNLKALCMYVNNDHLYVLDGVKRDKLMNNDKVQECIQHIDEFEIPDKLWETSIGISLHGWSELWDIRKEYWQDWDAVEPPVITQDQIYTTRGEILHVLTTVCKIFNLMPYQLCAGKDRLTAFSIQSNGHMLYFICDPDEYIIKGCIEDISEKGVCTNPIDFKSLQYRAQSLCTFGKKLLEILCGSLPKCQYNQDGQALMKHFRGQNVALCQYFGGQKIHNQYSAYDIAKCYTSCLYGSDPASNSPLFCDNSDFPIFSIVDEVQPFDQSIITRDENGKIKLPLGNYLISAQNDLILDKKQKLIRIPKETLRDSVFVEYCLNNNIIQVTDIKLQYLSGQYMRRSIFKEFIDFVYEHIPNEKAKKNIINHLNGTFNRHTIKTQNMFISQSRDIIKSYIAESIKNNDTIPWHTYKIGEDLYLCYQKISTPCNYNLESIYRRVIDTSIIKLANLVDYVQKDDGTSQILSVRNDCVYGNNLIRIDSAYEDMNNRFHAKYYLRPAPEPSHKTPRFNYIRVEDSEKSLYFGNKTIKASELYNPTTSSGFEINPPISNVNILSADEDESYDIIWEQGGVITGRAGTGKSYTYINKLLPRISDEERNSGSVAVTSTTHASLLQIKQIYPRARTLASVTYSPEGVKKDIHQMLKIRRIIVDEASMIGISDMRYLYNLNQNYGCKIIFIGDPNQLAPVGVNERVYINSSSFVRDMTGNNVIKLSKIHRYDQLLANVANDILVSGTCPKLPICQDINDKSQHICFKNSTRISINEKIMQTLASDVSDDEKLLIPKPNVANCQDMVLIIGSDLLCKLNAPERNLYNNQRLVLQSWNTEKKEAILRSQGESICVSFEELGKYFRPGYAITTHCAQGSTIDGKIILHDVNSYDKRMLYTAVTRACKFSDLYTAESSIRSTVQDRLYKVGCYEVNTLGYHSVYIHYRQNDGKFELISSIQKSVEGYSLHKSIKVLQGIRGDSQIKNELEKINKNLISGDIRTPIVMPAAPAENELKLLGSIAYKIGEYTTFKIKTQKMGEKFPQKKWIVTKKRTYEECVTLALSHQKAISEMLR